MDIFEVSKRYTEIVEISNNLNAVLYFIIVISVVAFVGYEVYIFSKKMELRYRSIIALALSLVLAFSISLVTPTRDEICIPIVSKIKGESNIVQKWNNLEKEYLKELRNENTLDLNKLEVVVKQEKEENYNTKMEVAYYFTDTEGKQNEVKGVSEYLKENDLAYNQTKEYTIKVYYVPKKINNPFYKYASIDKGWYLESINKK